VQQEHARGVGSVFDGGPTDLVVLRRRMSTRAGALGLIACVRGHEALGGFGAGVSAAER
jgi:hypothetical protein